MNRRGFFRALAGFGLAAASTLLWRQLRPGREAADDHENPPAAALSVFPPRFREALEVTTELLLPASERGVGAKGANAMGYIEREVSLPEMAGVRRLFMQGAAQLDSVARTVSGTLFLQSGEAAQKTVIEQMIAGRGSKGAFDSQRFMRLLLALTLEGTFGDPAHGGNLGGAGWRRIGYDMVGPLACTGVGAEACGFSHSLAK